MTLKEIHDKYNGERNELRNQIYALQNKEKQVLENKLKELGLDGRVVRKSDGRIGELRVDITNCRTILFHPLTKKGEVSKMPNYDYSLKTIEESYEPYKEE